MTITIDTWSGWGLRGTLAFVFGCMYASLRNDQSIWFSAFIKSKKKGVHRKSLQINKWINVENNWTNPLSVTFIVSQFSHVYMVQVFTSNVTLSSRQQQCWFTWIWKGLRTGSGVQSAQRNVPIHARMHYIFSQIPVHEQENYKQQWRTTELFPCFWLWRFIHQRMIYCSTAVSAKRYV